MSKNNESNNKNPLFEDCRSLGPVASTLAVAKGINKAIKVIEGSEGPIDINVINSLEDNKDIEIELIMKSKNEEKVESKRNVLANKMTRTFNVKPRDGMLETTNYWLEVWSTDHGHMGLFVYGGKKAPRRSADYEIREEGVYRLDASRDHFIEKWDMA